MATNLGIGVLGPKPIVFSSKTRYYLNVVGTEYFRILKPGVLPYHTKNPGSISFVMPDYDPKMPAKLPATKDDDVLVELYDATGNLLEVRELFNVTFSKPTRASDGSWELPITFESIKTRTIK